MKAFYCTFSFLFITISAQAATVSANPHDYICERREVVVYERPGALGKSHYNGCRIKIGQGREEVYGANELSQFACLSKCEELYKNWKNSQQ